MKHKILIVDDEPANVRLLERLFRRDYNVLTAPSGAEALRVLEQHDAALIITDQRMPGMTGVELLKRTASLRPHTVRIILTGYTDVEALVEAINCGQVYKYVNKPWDNDELRLTVSRAIEYYEANKSRHELALTNQRLVSRMKAMTHGFVRAIADALEARDEYVHGHGRRTSGYAAAIGRGMGLDEATLERLSLAAFLHDLGKIGTPDSVLLKPAALTPEEQAVMRQHPKRGARMLAGIVDMEDVALAVRHHHEHFDGTGYPEGLSGERIPLLSRIIFVADAYDALTSPRPFREACSYEEALEQLQRGAGTKFDPQVVRAFAELESLARIRHAVESGFIFAPAAPAAGAGPSPLTFAPAVREVETEPVLAARVLREANAEVGGQPATKLPAACARLGEKRLREIVAGAGEASRLSRSNPRLWEHSLRAAEAARLLADETAVLDADDAYTLGLLHDLGEALLRSLFPATMGQADAADGERGDNEIMLFGVDHAQVGQWLLEACGLPRAMTVAVQTHHDAARINSPAALLLHVANAVAKANDPYAVAALDSIDSERLYMLGLSRNDLFRVHVCVGSAVEGRLDPVCAV